jgi:Meckel syndrome type 1 protein
VATTVPSASELASGSLPRGAPAIPLALQAPVAPVTPELLAAAVADAVAPARSATPQAAPAQAATAFELPLPAASQAQPQAPAQQAAAQPVLAQLLQANTRPAPRKGGEEATIATTSAVDAADLPKEASRPATPAPILPVPSPVAIAAATPDALAAQPTAASAPAPAATAERHDFAAVIDKLAEARELARPGRADMHLAHREFGQVSVQFELAGQALKVAMASADPGFAPAVQAALADRPVAAAADAARADNQPQRADTVTASAASWQAGPQADGQRQDNQGRAQQARADNAPVRTNEGDADSATARAADRDGSRFA